MRFLRVLMDSLFLMCDILNKGFFHSLLDFLYFISILFGLNTIINKNPIVSVLFLIGLFSTISLYLIFIGLDFIGLSYLLVYVGAVSILFIFILMLINIRISELLTETYNYLPLALFSIIPFFYILGNIIPSDNYLKDNILASSSKYNEIIYVSSNSWDSNLINNTQISSIGNVLYTNYSIWLLITSLILLLAMIGAIVITVKTKNK